jgi:hypothetical protein
VGESTSRVQESRVLRTSARGALHESTTVFATIVAAPAMMIVPVITTAIAASTTVSTMVAAAVAVQYGPFHESYVSSVKGGLPPLAHAAATNGGETWLKVSGCSLALHPPPPESMVSSKRPSKEAIGKFSLRRP